MPQRLKLSIVAALGLLIGAAALALVAAGGSDQADDVQIQARRLADGRVEVALKDSAGQRILPRERFLAADSEPDRWRSSTAIRLESGESVDPSAVGLTATAQMRGRDGESMGAVTIIQGPRGLLVQARLIGVPEGWHGFHIHEVGTCAPDFAAAGGHYNPTDVGHGPLHEAGHHAGDTVNVYAHADGAVNADQYTTDVTLGDGATSVFDVDGSTFILHAAPDTYGEAAGAGARIACGVIALD